MNESHQLMDDSSENDIIIYKWNYKENENVESHENFSIISKKCIFIKLTIFLFSISFILIYLLFFKNSNQNIINNHNYINSEPNNEQKNELDNEGNNILINNMDEDYTFETHAIIKGDVNEKSACDKFDPIKVFNLRLKKNTTTIICKNKESNHICYQNNNNYYNDILFHPNGTICTMKNIILDPSKSAQSKYIYKGPVDSEKRGFPRLSKGFFNMKCTKPKNLEIINNIYETYFDSWDYDYENKNETIEELAPGKTVFFLSRNQDSPNLFHGNSEIINAISIMNLFHLEPENIQVVFLESLKINNDPFYDIYKNIISRGGEPIYIRNLKKKYHISSAIHIPINWDSPVFFTQESYVVIPKPDCKYPSKAYKLYNDLINKYLNIKNFTDSFISDKKVFYYPKIIIKRHRQNIKFNKTVTFQWRKVWPKGRKGQSRLLGNGPRLADKLASILPKNILVRLVDTASLSTREQISIMRNTDYFIAVHGAGLSLSIFMSNKSIAHEILNTNNINVLTMMSEMSGHQTFSDIIIADVRSINENENIFFDENDFAEKIINRMKESHFI